MVYVLEEIFPLGKLEEKKTLSNIFRILDVSLFKLCLNKVKFCHKLTFNNLNESLIAYLKKTICFNK